MKWRFHKFAIRVCQVPTGNSRNSNLTFYFSADSTNAAAAVAQAAIQQANAVKHLVNKQVRFLSKFSKLQTSKGKMSESLY